MSALLHGRWLKMNDAKAAMAQSMYDTGNSIGKIAKIMGVSRQSLYGTLKRLETKFRPRHRYGQANHFYRGGKKAVDAAQNKLEKAILRGRIRRPRACQQCKRRPPPFKDGRSAIQAHHPDYSKPLEVRWLCQRCHHQVHTVSA